MVTPKHAMNKREVLVLLARALKDCSLKRRPPKKKQHPLYVGGGGGGGGGVVRDWRRGGGCAHTSHITHINTHTHNNTQQHLVPSTRSRFDRIDPINDMATTLYKPLFSAAIDNNNSTTLPKVALHKPPTMSPKRNAKSSVIGAFVLCVFCVFFWCFVCVFLYV